MSLQDWVRDTTAGCRVSLHIVPGASRDEVVGLHAGRLKLKVTAPPEEGRANAAVAELLARVLGISKTRVVLESGASGRQKVFLLMGVHSRDARPALLASFASSE